MLQVCELSPTSRRIFSERNSFIDQQAKHCHALEVQGIACSNAKASVVHDELGPKNKQGAQRR